MNQENIYIVIYYVIQSSLCYNVQNMVKSTEWQTKQQVDGSKYSVNCKKWGKKRFRVLWSDVWKHDYMKYRAQDRDEHCLETAFFSLKVSGEDPTLPQGWDILVGNFLYFHKEKDPFWLLV